jgi:hypothetical protein
LQTPHLRKAVIFGILTLQVSFCLILKLHLYFQLTTALWIIFYLSSFFFQEVGFGATESGWASTALGCLYFFGSSYGAAIVEKQVKIFNLN